MKKTALAVLAALAVLSSPCRASELEALAAGAAVSFQAAALRFSTFKFAPAPVTEAARLAATQLASIGVLDVERMYQQGAKVEKKDVAGWFAGRRYSAKGVCAQLLLGVDVLRDPDSGALGGSDLKLASLGGNEPAPGAYVQYFDDLSPEVINSVLSIIYEEGASWKAAEFKDTGARGQDKRETFEVRKSGDYLVARFVDGSYAYYFKKVR